LKVGKWAKSAVNRLTIVYYQPFGVKLSEFSPDDVVPSVVFAVDAVPFSWSFPDRRAGFPLAWSGVPLPPPVGLVDSVVVRSRFVRIS